MKSRIGFLVSILFLTITVMATHQFGGMAVDRPLNTNLRIDHEVSDKDVGVASILQDVLRGTGVPGGVAESGGCSDFPKGRLSVKPGISLPQAMNALIAANASYRWWMELGVVNLIPRDGVPLLGTKISNFQADATDLEIPAVNLRLLRVPEVRKRAIELGLSLALGQGGIGAVELHPVPRELVTIHLRISDVSLRDAFNQVVRSAGHMIWIYHESDCNGKKTYTVATTPN